MTDQPVALITGGSSGLGYATAHRMLRAGYRTVITGRNQEKLTRATEALGPDCLGMAVDMNDLDAMPGLVTDLIAQLGRLDVLVNNAGINQKKPMLEVTNEDFQRIIHTNQTALFALSREAAKVMQTQPSRGVIIHISSMAAQYGIPQVISYTAAKTAVEGMTRAMAVDLGPLGIRVNCVAPGFIETPMSAKAFSDDPARKQRVLARTPLGKMGQPADVANAVLFLASDQAAFISGTVLRVDGGNAIGF
jgi:NAD(P)-dependent dehydrogenase (short-subunit alcohol dehydrogenase family)